MQVLPKLDSYDKCVKHEPSTQDEYVVTKVIVLELFSYCESYYIIYDKSSCKCNYELMVCVNASV